MLTVFSFIGCIQAVTLELNEGNSTCIKAELSASFSITYNATNSTVRTVTTVLYMWNHWCWFSQLYFLVKSKSGLLYVCRKHHSSHCLTLPESIQAAAPAAQTAAQRGWWPCLDLAMHSGWAFQPMEVCTVSLTWLCSTTSATPQSSQRPTALVRTAVYNQVWLN